MHDSRCLRGSRSSEEVQSKPGEDAVKRRTYLWMIWDMEKAKAVAKRARPGALVQGRKVASAAQGMTLVQVGRVAKKTVPSEGQAKVLVHKAAKALRRPGIDREVVFRRPDVYSYSINPEDPTQFIREDANGVRTLGYVSKGKFHAVKA